MSDIGDLSSLEELIIKDDIEMKTSLPDSIGRLKNLRILDLEGRQGGHDEDDDIPGWQSLPRTLATLQSLTILNLYGCKYVKELPAGIGELRCLEDINVGHCDQIAEKKETYVALGKIPTLRRLSMMCCRTIVALPEEIGGLTSLQYFDLALCNQLEDLSVGTNSYFPHTLAFSHRAETLTPTSHSRKALYSCAASWSSS